MTSRPVSPTPVQTSKLLRDIDGVPLNRMGEHLTDDDLVGYSLDPSQLGEEQRVVVDAHLESCDDCADQMERLLDIAREWRGEAGTARLEALSQRINAARVTLGDKDKNEARAPRESWRVAAQEGWYQMGPLRYAFAGLAAAVLALVPTVVALGFGWAFERGRSSALVQIAQVETPNNVAFDNIAMQRQMALVAVMQQLSSRDPWDRAAALRTGQVMKLPQITDLAERHATVDRDRTVREAARAIILDSPDADAVIERVSSAGTLRAELGTPEIRRMLEDADAYVLGGATNGAAEAVRLYSEVLDRLSAKARRAFHSGNLEAARNDVTARKLDEAALRFKELFANFRVTDEVPRPEK